MKISWERHFSVASCKRRWMGCWCNPCWESMGHSSKREGLTKHCHPEHHDKERPPGQKRTIVTRLYNYPSLMFGTKTWHDKGYMGSSVAPLPLDDEYSRDSRPKIRNIQGHDISRACAELVSVLDERYLGSTIRVARFSSPPTFLLLILLMFHQSIDFFYTHLTLDHLEDSISLEINHTFIF